MFYAYATYGRKLRLLSNFAIDNILPYQLWISTWRKKALLLRISSYEIQCTRVWQTLLLSQKTAEEQNVVHQQYFEATSPRLGWGGTQSTVPITSCVRTLKCIHWIRYFKIFENCVRMALLCVKGLECGCLTRNVRELEGLQAHAPA